MRGVSDFIKEHQKRLAKAEVTDDFVKFHLKQIQFLQHERLVHLIVMLWFAFIALLFFGLFIILEILSCLIIFGLLIGVTIFYVLHYFKLENTVIAWYFFYNDKIFELEENDKK